MKSCALFTLPFPQTPPFESLIPELKPGGVGKVLHEMYHAWWDLTGQDTDNPVSNKIRNDARAVYAGKRISDAKILDIQQERIAGYVQNYAVATISKRLAIGAASILHGSISHQTVFNEFQPLLEQDLEKLKAVQGYINVWFGEPPPDPFKITIRQVPSEITFVKTHFLHVSEDYVPSVPDMIRSEGGVFVDGGTSRARYEFPR